MFLNPGVESFGLDVGRRMSAHIIVVEAGTYIRIEYPRFFRSSRLSKLHFRTRIGIFT